MDRSRRPVFALIEANTAMMDIVLSPWDRLPFIIDSGKTNLAVVRTVDHFGLTKLAPANGIISLEGLAKAANMKTQVLERIIRCCFTIHLFKESQPGEAAHTSLSAAIPAMSPWIRISTSEIVEQAFFKMPHSF